jgi:DNA-binding response OmpR family regulator
VSTQSALRDPSGRADSDSIAPILIVDDHAQTAKAVAGIIRRAGFETVVANCGADALDFVSEHRPSAALVDVHLTDLSGLVLTSKLRERMGEEMPIIILSGDTSMETLNSLPLVGATYFFSKPVNAKHLVERLGELLRPQRSV